MSGGDLFQEPAVRPIRIPAHVSSAEWPCEAEDRREESVGYVRPRFKMRHKNFSKKIRNMFFSSTASCKRTQHENAHSSEIQPGPADRISEAGGAADPLLAATAEQPRDPSGQNKRSCPVCMTATSAHSGRVLARISRPAGHWGIA
jgi:hypothetical protein